MDIKDILSKVDHTLLNPKATWEEIKNICNNEKVMEILENYPFQRNKKSLSFFNYCIKKKYVHLLYIMVRLKEKR